jgi:predicted RNA-binding Zn ribbon-like protein
LQHIPTKLDHDNEFIAGAPALDFANTIGGSRERPTHDHFGRYADLVVFAGQGGLIDHARARKLLAAAERDPLGALSVLERGLRLRDAIRSVFPLTRGVPDQSDLAVISDEAARAAAHRTLTPHGDGYAWSWRDEDELERVLWPIAHSAAELLTSDMNRSAVRECESDTCSWLFVDRTRNHSRRWCDMGDCGNRAKSRRFRERRSSANEGSARRS